MVRFLEQERPDLLVTIDFPDFNLRLAARARRAGTDVVYFVSPQVWAWRAGRVRTIRRLVRRMLVLFPFETAIYEAAGVPVTFVGHPVSEQPPPVRAPGQDTLALLPGSRRGEVARLLPPLLEAGRIVQDRRPGVRFVLPLASGLDPAWVGSLVERGPLPGVRILRDGYPAILADCRAGVVASGTASLEAAVAGLPIVVVYRMNPLSHAIGRLLVRVEHIALPNLVAGRRVVPELVQRECTGERIATELLRYLEEPAHEASVRRQLGAIRDRLGGPGVFERAAERILAELAGDAG
jgi:lipid-A-disaccharide synthase